MMTQRTIRVLALALGLSVVAGSRGWSQEAGKKDEALDSLLEKLAEPAGGPKSKAAGSAKPEGPRAKSDRPAKPGPGGTPAGQPSGAKAKAGGPATVAPKDQELDELLQKLGETKETPAPDERPRPGAGPGETKDQPQPAPA